MVATSRQSGASSSTAAGTRRIESQISDSGTCRPGLFDHDGTLEIKMRFSAAAPKGSELFSHFFLFPLLDDGDEPNENLDMTNCTAAQASAAPDAAWDAM